MERAILAVGHDPAHAPHKRFINVGLIAAWVSAATHAKQRNVEKIMVLGYQLPPYMATVI